MHLRCYLSKPVERLRQRIEEDVLLVRPHAINILKPIWEVSCFLSIVRMRRGFRLKIARSKTMGRK
ncbi:MAG: hypothetical protein JWP38_2919 [Herbaspirillum sp.]|nr:hypothetical protein [Herbaspirillum sp.]